MPESVMPVMCRALVPEVLPAVMPQVPAVPEFLPAAPAAGSSSPGPAPWIARSPSRMIPRCRQFAGVGKSTCANVDLFKADCATLTITHTHSPTPAITGQHLKERQKFFA